jgi:RNA recognition motif-containing protein
MAAIPPNLTLYVHNLPEKVKVDVVKEKLKMVFSQYGKVDNIVVGTKLAAKGQVSKGLQYDDGFVATFACSL